MTLQSGSSSRQQKQKKSKSVGRVLANEGQVKKYLIHAIAECRVCGKQWQNYLTVQQLAAAHARDTGHTVTADLGYTATYLGTRKP